jgi:D-beta-D-heptose 7-phosphate kinase/D-beta-D-heptose 1-phosphate adenosyltransferase
VPVVEVTGESFYPGGAANVARNLREFVGHVAVVGMFGSDRGGRQLRDLMEEQEIETKNAVEDPGFSTIVKTRIIARNQQVVRVDREQLRSPTPAQVSAIVRNVNGSLPRPTQSSSRITKGLPGRRAGARIWRRRSPRQDRHRSNPHHPIE